ncbi:MAG TPA: sigma-54 dependent transcriptional regulator [Thermoanaerobaculia bacterium]|nr:sigma-54 dependent transcriptional regulator [Thermoanaerobaculia bacterium]
MPHALAVDDDPNFLSALAELIEAQGFTTNIATNLRDARTQVSHRTPDVALIDLYLPDGRGTELLKDLDRDRPTEVVLMTGHADVESAVQALRLGASDYLTKPLDISRLKAILANVASARPAAAPASAAAAAQPQERESDRLELLLGASPPMHAVYEMMTRVAPTDATVFFVGESGTGKDLAAQSLHLLSRRVRAPFLPLNCGAISPTLIESELFGHERGSFTGAARLHKGYFERANNGSLFLDEITEMPIELQVKLLRVLETGGFMRIGGDHPVEVNVRVVAASNRDPHQAVKDGKLREDLLYRLSVFPILMPPLRDRGDDVDLLAHYFLSELNQHEGTAKTLSEEALERFREHSWPGNVRELKNVVHRAYIMADGEITLRCLPHELGGDSGGARSLHFQVGASIADVEKRLILATLELHGGNKRKAAEVLGVSLKTLYNRLNTYKLE